MTDEYEPAYDVVTLLVGGDFHAADAVAAQWIDQGNADILIESLADTALSLLEQLADVVDQDTDVVWRRFVVTETAGRNE